MGAVFRLGAALLAGLAAWFLGVSLNRAGLDPWVAGLAACLALMAAWQLQGSLVAVFERRSMRARMREITRSQTMLFDQLELVRAEMGALTHTYESTSRQRNQRLISEMRMLEDLVQQLNNRSGDKAADLAPGPDPVPSASPPSQTVPSRQVDPHDQGRVDATAMDAAPVEPVTLAMIKDALEDNRVDLHLQPIVSLPQRRVRYFEGLTRLRTREGRILMPGDYLPIAERAGLISAIDNLLLFKGIQIVRRLASRDRKTGLVCNISGYTLRDETFFGQFTDFLRANRELTRQIIFEFGQSAFDHAGPEEMARLKTLASLGYTFSLDRVQTLDLDPHYLHDRNIRFVKIPARLLLDRHAQEAARIEAGDLKALFARHGVDLIVEKIEDERTVVEVLEYDVDFGQGYLFGAPKPIHEAFADAG